MSEWILPDLGSAVALGLYDTSKKAAVKGNHVLPVLFWATACGTCFYLLSMLVLGHFSSAWHCTASQYGLIWVKSCIVGASWYYGYAALATLPLSLAAPIRATAPLWTFLGSLFIYHEIPTFFQGAGMLLIFSGYAILNAWGNKEGFSFLGSKGVKYCFIGTLIGAGSSLYDKYLLNVCRVPSLTVQLHFSIDLVILFGFAMLLAYIGKKTVTCQWRWTIPATGICLILADFAFFQAVSMPGIQISQVSLVRRSSCLVTFAMSALVFKDKHICGKAAALLLIILGVAVIALFPH